MRTFNLLTEAIKEATHIGDNYYILAKSGAPTLFKTDWRTGFLSKERTTAQVLIVNQRDSYLEWKMVYKNSKGYYIKLCGNKYIHYMFH